MRKVLLNYSTFVGNDKPDSLRQMRYFQNFYGIIWAAANTKFSLGFDYGLEQRAKGSKTTTFGIGWWLLYKTATFEQVVISYPL